MTIREDILRASLTILSGNADGAFADNMRWHFGINGNDKIKHSQDEIELYILYFENPQEARNRAIAILKEAIREAA